MIWSKMVNKLLLLSFLKRELTKEVHDFWPHNLVVWGLEAITVLPIGDWWNWWSQPLSSVAAFLQMTQWSVATIYSSSIVSKGLLFFPLLLLPSSSLPMLDTGDFISDLRIWGLMTFAIIDTAQCVYCLVFVLHIVEAWTYLKTS